ncbi:hypothetical protein BGX29_008575 [Mortierella sp. GBA35]|nr:hypothetical protein BGX23_000736 [Mortierella sp. AD031]KAF9096394.1 hypothetical protein BGX29_008575 [Mortierella sp. GBA35]KAG0198590.1 hypothetical protein BGX33_012247 [Mortierella sp. NVP41]
MALPFDNTAFHAAIGRVTLEMENRLDSLEAKRQTLPPRPFPPAEKVSEFGQTDPGLVELLQSRWISQEGNGFDKTVETLVRYIAPAIADSAGPRYFGLVTGGATPASLVADWIVSVVDQNTILHSPRAMSGYSVIKDLAMRMVLDLFLLPTTMTDSDSAQQQQAPLPLPRQNDPNNIDFRALITTGSTASNVMGMAAGRQWLGIHDRQVDYSQDGYDGQVVVVTNMAHATVWKAASILGIGRKQVVEVPEMGMDQHGAETAFEDAVQQQKRAGKSVLVFMSYGEVNTGIFPLNTHRIADICKSNNAYLHIDGAFGIYARCSPKYAHLAHGLERAHSITACGHKWLNVPYDCGFFIYRSFLEKTILEPVFSSSAAYLPSTDSGPTHPMNISIENSQRFRALPVWATLYAYGRAGYQKIVEENCRYAKTLFDWMKNDRPDLYTVLTEECPLNIVVFAQKVSAELEALEDDAEEEKKTQALAKRNAELLKRINETGVAYFSPTVWKGRPAIRAAISNWRTTVEQDWEPVRAMLEQQATIVAKVLS